MPWFEYPGLDFVTENLYPGKVEDVRRFRYTAWSRWSRSADDLLQQAEQLRQRGRAVNGGEPAPQQ